MNSPTGGTIREDKIEPQPALPVLEYELSSFDGEAKYAEPSTVAVAVAPYPGEISLDQPLHLPDIPAILSRQRKLLIRLLECFPAVAAALIITSLIWGPLLAPIPFAIAILSFHVFWLWRAFMNGTHAVKGYFLLRKHEGIDWEARFAQAVVADRTPFAWDELRHIVIIPNYTESIDKLRMCLDSVASSPVASQIVAVLAMEEREGEPGREKATTLVEEYSGRIGRVMPTFHPFGLPGEVVGKSSNENWAARRAKERLIDVEGGDIRVYTITSCDVDTVFRADYFPYLSYKFATNPDRYRRFWQGPIFYYNNIWHVPAPARIQHSLSGMTHLGRVSRGFFRMVFPQSTYSLSLQMATQAGFWDPDIVPEDWHMFLKCYYALGGDVDVETLYTPIYMDGIRSKTYLKTFLNYYDQNRRHAWGCSDIPYAMCQFWDHPEIPFFQSFRRLWSLIETHLLWSTQWFLITAGRALPYALVALGLTTLPGWFPAIDRWLLVPTGGTLILMIVLDSLSRPKRPSHWPVWLYPVQYAQWFLMAVITFFTSALPGVDAQARLAIGKRLEYRVTEKA